jgi:transcriptional regulator with XRE-family HTH domain
MAENPGPKVGKRIKALRDRQALSLRALAERCGLSINAISQIERGENSPTVASLHRLATALNVPITDLFQDETRQTTVFVKRALGLRSQSSGVVMESLGIGLFNQKLVPFRMVIQPGVENVDAPISHSGEEFVHCLEGKIECCVGERVFQLEEGDSLLFDATQMHSYQNRTAGHAEMLIIFLASQDMQLTRQLHLNA